LSLGVDELLDARPAYVVVLDEVELVAEVVEGRGDEARAPRQARSAR
jgi:hypothetical protein